MLKIHNPAQAGDLIPFPIADDKRYVTHVYDGRDTLTFEIDSNDPLYQHIAEEVRIDDENNGYIVKSVDEHSDFITVVCDLNLDDWKESILYSFRSTNKLLAEVLQDILPEGWSIEWLSQFSQRTTVEKSEGKPLQAVTPLEVLEAAASAYGCVFNFQTLTKTLKVIDPQSFTPSGQFFTDELNLRSLGFTGSSKGFVTRLYAYGKPDDDGNPLTFASINGGKPYVEDFSYSDKIVCAGWSDERYTDPESLLEDAKERLRSMAFPDRSYSCEAENLNEEVWLYKVVTLVDRRRKTRVNHQIVEFQEYPDHSLDVITLSKVAPSIQSHVSSVAGTIQEEISKASSSLEDAIVTATDKITGNKGGHFVWIFDAQGRPIELLNLCDADSLEAARSVWRWNAEGLGHSNQGYNGAYALALLADGSINASAIKTGSLDASLIKTGVLQSTQGKIRLDLSDESTEAVFNTGISTDGLTVRSDAHDSPELFRVDVRKVPVGNTEVDIPAVVMRNTDAKGMLLINSDGAVRDGKFVHTGAELNLLSPDDTSCVQLLTLDDESFLNLRCGQRGSIYAQLRLDASAKSSYLSVGEVQTKHAWLSPSSGGGGGFWVKFNSSWPGSFLATDENTSVLTTTKINGKTISWKKNSDGTYTLIGS